MLPGTFRAIMARAALVAAVAGCSLMPGATPAPAGQAQREVLIGQFIDAVERGDAAAIAGMTGPVVDARADIAQSWKPTGAGPGATSASLGARTNLADRRSGQTSRVLP